MDEMRWLPNPVQAWPQKATSLRHSTVIPIENIQGKLHFVPVDHVGDTGAIPTTWATFFQTLPATAGRVQAMYAECVLSIRGLWVGPVICNEGEREKSIEKGSISVNTFAPQSNYYDYYIYFIEDSKIEN